MDLFSFDYLGPRQQHDDLELRLRPYRETGDTYYFHLDASAGSNESDSLARLLAQWLALLDQLRYIYPTASLTSARAGCKSDETTMLSFWALDKIALRKR